MSRRTQNGGGDQELSAGDGDDEDDVFDEDMEALRRACMLVGADPDEYRHPSSSLVAGDDIVGGGKSDSDSDADLELLRSIRDRFSIADECPSLPLKPLSTLPPASPEEEEDDFQILRAIQRRFEEYENDAQRQSMNIPNQSSDSDGPLEMESSGKTLVDTQTSLGRSTMLAFGKATLPKAALLFIDAIKKNRSQQKFIRSKMIHLEAKIEENKDLRKRFKILKDFQVSCRRRTGCALSQKKDPRFQLISSQKSLACKDSSKKEKRLSAMDYGPVENSHVANYRMALEKYPFSLDRKKWSNVERKNLLNGIKQQFQEMVLQISVDQASGLEGFLGDSDDFDDILTSVKELDITPYKIREFLPKVNWDKLASMYLAGRSGAECEARWLNFEDPLINQNGWTVIEDKNLLFIIQQKGINNWIETAISLGTNRTPFQCLSRYQRSLNASILKREWTKDEDDKLRSAVVTFGKGNWQAIASALEGRTGPQCSNRWKKSLDPARTKRGSFTPDEDNRLKIAVLLFGPKNWNKKAEFLPGRNQVQCRERWFNCLDPSLRRCEWTEEEDLRLEVAIQEHGYSWAKVAACVPSRTDNDCRRRWMKLFPNEVPLLQEARRIQKAALISNFVDRESERPSLGPTDFQPLPNTKLLCDAKNSEPAAKGNMRSGDIPKKIRSKRRTRADGVIAQVDVANRSSVLNEAEFNKPRRKINRRRASVTRKPVSEMCSNNDRCAEKILDTESIDSRPNGRESEPTNSDFIENVDVNGSKVCENRVAETLSTSEVCFSVQAENQNSTGSSGVSVLSETSNDPDHHNLTVVPDTAVIAPFDGDDTTVTNGGSKGDANVDSADSNSFSSPHGCLELRIIDGEGVNSCPIDKTSDKMDRACKLQIRRKRSARPVKRKQNSVPCQQVQPERLGSKVPFQKLNFPALNDDDDTRVSFCNKAKKRKREGAGPGPGGHHNNAKPILPSSGNSDLEKIKRTARKKADGNPSSIPIVVDNGDDDPPLILFLHDKLKKRKRQAACSTGVVNSR